MSVPSEMEVDRKERGLVAVVAIILLVVVAIVFVTGAIWYQGFNSPPPSAKQQSEEVTALETHVLPLVKDSRATWYLNERFGSDSISWKRGKFTKDAERARQDGDELFDKETEEAFEQLSQAIRASGVPSHRLCEAQFGDDGTLRRASFQRRGGGLEYVYTYIYSPGAKPEEWTSKLGPVVLTRIGDSDWWFEQSPND